MVGQVSAVLGAVTADGLIKVAPAVVAVVSVFLGPWLQWRIARKQALLQERIAQRQAADNVSAKRQVWIDELRRDVARYLTVFGLLEDLRRPAPGLDLAGRKLNFEDIAAASGEAVELGIRIKLRLNPNEGEHNEFVQLLGALSDACGDPPPNETEDQKLVAQHLFRQARDNVIAHLQTILKHEWERVKKGAV